MGDGARPALATTTRTAEPRCSSSRAGPPLTSDFRTARAWTTSPGGRIVVHEYFAYERWKLVPQDAAYEEFVAAVMASWRARGGEPNVGLSLVPWLERLGLTIEHTRTMTDLVNPRHHRWHWPTAFAATAVERLVELGDVDFEAAQRMSCSIKDSWNDGAWMMTPGVVEVVARK